MSLGILEAVEVALEVVNGVRCVLGFMLCMLVGILEAAEGQFRLLEVLE